MPSGRYIGIPHEVYRTVPVPVGSALPVVAAIGEGNPGAPSNHTSGWANPESPDSVNVIYQEDYSEVVAVDTTGAVLKTYLWHFTQEIVETGDRLNPYDTISVDIWMPIDTVTTNSWYYSCFVRDVTTSGVQQTAFLSQSGNKWIQLVRPNPSNPNAEVTVVIPEASVGDLTVYDVRGRRVLVLASGSWGEGTHRIWWDGSDNSGKAVGSGTYFVRFSAGSVSETKKFTLVR